MLLKFVSNKGSEVFVCKHWAQGSKGVVALAERVSQIADEGKNSFRYLYNDENSLLKNRNYCKNNI